MATIVVAATTANVTHRGQRVHIEAGTAWDGGDSLVKAFPDMFTTDSRMLRRTDDPVVEQATAAPGERRGTRRS